MTSSRLEYRFGPARPGDTESDPDSASKAFVLDVDGEKIRITGQIDRIDVGTLDGRTVFSIIDYKSGRRPAFSDAHIESGERLQLPIYVAAAQALVFNGKAEPLLAGYWTMTGGFDAKGALAVKQEVTSSERWEKVREMIEKRVAQSVAEIRRGDFPVASRDENCTHYCEFRTVCRVAQVRSLGKIWHVRDESQESRAKSQKLGDPSPQPPAPSP
jgi:ATP-dependent helicase/DNAse subunit B